MENDDERKREKGRRRETPERQLPN